MEARKVSIIVCFKSRPLAFTFVKLTTLFLFDLGILLLVLLFFYFSSFFSSLFLFFFPTHPNPTLSQFSVLSIVSFLSSQLVVHTLLLHLTCCRLLTKPSSLFVAYYEIPSQYYLEHYGLLDFWTFGLLDFHFYWLWRKEIKIQ